MTTRLGDIDALLSDALDPLFIVDADLAIVWANEAFTKLYAPASRPLSAQAVFGDDATTLFLGIAHYKCFDISFQTVENGTLHQTAIVIEVSTGDLGETNHLVALKSAPHEDTVVQKKFDWLSGVAHDLKNPLSAIFGYADALLDTDLNRGLNSEQRRILGRIRATAARANDLVRNYQQISQLTVSGVMRSASQQDLNAAIHDTVHNTWREDHSQPTLVLDLVSEPLTVHIDRIHLDRIISNLFNNALKFAAPDSVVTIRSGKATQGVWFSIHNFGKPIHQDEIPRLFTPFTRLSSSHGTPGTGLGLAIVKSLIDGYGGDISVTSVPDQGTTFTVSLPS